MASKTKQNWWQNRIIQHGVAPANSFLAHEMNARRHPAKQREALRGSLDSLGWIAPVVVSAKTGKMLDGHARIEEALSRDEMMGVPFVEVEVSEDEERLILATLDPISALATYDKDALESLLAEVSTNDAAINQMLADLSKDNGLSANKPGAGGDDYDTTPDAEQTRVEYGDLWACGEHRVLCGDSTKAEDVAKVMAKERAVACITDPPYCVDYENQEREPGRETRKDKGDPYIDPINSVIFLESFFANIPSDVACMTFLFNKHLHELSAATIEWDMLYECVWMKNHFAYIMGRRFQPKHEPILIFRRKKYKVSKFNVPPDQSTVFQHDKPSKNDGHPTIKPLALFDDLVRFHSDRDDVVYDPFGGSGTTLIACERTNRKARLIEIEPKYVNVILSRYEVETGKQAQLLERRSLAQTA